MHSCRQACRDAAHTSDHGNRQCAESQRSYIFLTHVHFARNLPKNPSVCWSISNQCRTSNTAVSWKKMFRLSQLQNLTKPEGADGLGHLWIKPVWMCNLSSMLNFIEDWDYVCFTAIWATSQWPWDQPQDQFCHFLICWCVPRIVLWPSFGFYKETLICVLHTARVLPTVQSNPQTPFLIHKPPPPHSGFAYGQPAWEAFLHSSCWHWWSSCLQAKGQQEEET